MWRRTVAKKILVIDDSEVMLRMVVKSLRDAGYEARGTPDLVRFGRHLTEFKPDLVLADVFMPALLGDDLCRELKTQFSDSRLPVYLISGMAEGELDNRARLCGADGYISKRAGFQVFLKKIEDILQGV
jgi:DNA-binding response OmpR family regulator